MTMRCRVSIAMLMLAASLFSGVVAPALAQRSTAAITTHGRSGGVSVDIPINKSDVLRSSHPFFEVAVGNPEIADVQVLGDSSLYIFGRAFGATSVTLSDETGGIIAVVDVNVVHDIGRLKQMLHAVMPAERIAVRTAADGIVLSGMVSSPDAAASAVAIAERFAPETVSNLMTVRGSQQVMLSVKFVEVRRSALKRLGVNTEFSLIGSALDVGGRIAQTFTAPASLGRIGGVVGVPGTNAVGSFLDLLEDKGVVRTLAEPTLVAMSGDTADFLAGGEFPIPVGVENNQITIEFKKFGVGLAFTPTVLGDERVNLRLFMEVSERDETQDFELAGIRVPGLTVRRATTTVELRNAQSFAIAGLLGETFTDQVKQLPFISDLPILGALTRSTEYRTGQTELVMIVTPYFVAPVDGSHLRTPGFTAPSERELFLGGIVEGQSIDPNLNGAAGFSGPHGYSTW